MTPGSSAAALLAFLAALYAATDPLRIGPTVGFTDFRAIHVEQPSPAQLGDFQGDPHNRLAARAEVRFSGQICGPESIAFDPQGRGPYTGICDGRVLRWDEEQQAWIEFAVTSSNRSACAPKDPPRPNLANEHICGRPLGLRFKKSSSELYIADAYKGLLVVGSQGGLATPLVTEVEGQPLLFTNDLDLDEDGRVYFTVTSSKYQRRNFILPILEGDDTGLLLKYDPSTKQVSVLLRGLQFPNGVSMSKDYSFLVFAETTNGKLTRYWLKGPKAGTPELFAILPGHPDNVRTNENGEFWVAIHALRNPRCVSWGPLPIPAKMIAGGSPYALILKYDADGKLIDALEDHKGQVASYASEAEEHDGHLWLGTVLLNKIVVYKL
ncbi:hypothetical protein SELMODRAFT_231921 [Selaginella moellendorffii]|uniref:Strictosidine synthase conserved region domain-containing protein n=1 Tax=Selaginella moellendorffii TaxID=88036 RepID=D8RMN1_SELML|nr:hypothetical protein SELMODRAFT_231921 [Selaginella moellendorffii]